MDIMQSTLRLPLWGLWVLLLTACSEESFDIDNLCSIYAAQPQWEQAAQRSEAQWGIPQELMMAVIRFESSFEAEAMAPRRRYFGFIPGEHLSSAYGFSQALDLTWEEYQQRSGNMDAVRDNFADAIDFVGWYLNRTHRSLQIPRSDGYQLYLAYHEGHRGFLRKDYEQKPALMAVAHRVNAARINYRIQLKQCRPEADKVGG